MRAQHFGEFGQRLEIARGRRRQRAQPAMLVKRARNQRMLAGVLERGQQPALLVEKVWLELGDEALCAGFGQRRHFRCRASARVRLTRWAMDSAV